MPTISERASAVRFIEPNEEFRRCFDRVPMQFTHSLANHPLFALPRLLELARVTRQRRPKDMYYDAGDFGVAQRWDQTGPKPFPVDEAFHRIEHAGAWILLHRAQEDPEYAPLFRQCMQEFEELTGADMTSVVKMEDALIFITSPRRTTAYHIDRECNFLLQIRGEKSIYVFDRNDREVLPEQEIERFWSVDHNAAIYKPDLQDRATTFRLVPGNGVHIPVNAPHWLRNDDNISISLSVNFTHKDSTRANLYRANHALRRLGITPTPPGRSPIRDEMKRKSVGAVVNVRQGLRRLGIGI